jgi:7 transmembrane receptor (rhodopsin family)
MDTSFSSQLYGWLCVTVGLLRFVGNLNNFVTYFKSNKIRTISNKFITAMALNDLLMGIVIIGQAYYHFYPYFGFVMPDWLCKFQAIILVNLVWGPMILIALIGASRYLFVCKQVSYILKSEIY